MNLNELYKKLSLRGKSNINIFLNKTEEWLKYLSVQIDPSSRVSIPKPELAAKMEVSGTATSGNLVKDIPRSPTE